MHSALGTVLPAGSPLLPEVPQKTYREDAASLALSTSSVNATSVIRGVTASLARLFPHSLHEHSGQDVLLRESASWGDHTAPHNTQPDSFCSCPQLPMALLSACFLPALQNLPGAKNYHVVLRKMVPPRKENENQFSLST